jgi:hypothetical protein
MDSHSCISRAAQRWCHGFHAEKGFGPAAKDLDLSLPGVQCIGPLLLCSPMYACWPLLRWGGIPCGLIQGLDFDELLRRTVEYVEKSFKIRRMQHRTSKGPGPANRPNKASNRTVEYYGRGMSVHIFDKRKAVLCPLDPQARLTRPNSLGCVHGLKSSRLGVKHVLV